MDAETKDGLLIDGKVYEMATVSSLTMDEAELLYERCGRVQEEFVPDAGETPEEFGLRFREMVRPPAFWASLMQISYQRGNPDKTAAEAKAVVGKTNLADAMSTLGVEEDDPDLPLGLTSEPSEASNSSSLDSANSTKDSNDTSGSGSVSGLVAPGGHLVRIGTTSSGTSFTSAQRTLAGSGPAT